MKSIQFINLVRFLASLCLKVIIIRLFIDLIWDFLESIYWSQIKDVLKVSLTTESTLPDTESVGPDTAVESPELIRLQDLLG